MNRQRKVVITVTYNDLGMIVDTKTEELNLSAQPNLQQSCNQLATDCISRQAAIDAAVEAADEWDGGYSRSREEIITLKLRMLPSANKSGHWVMNPSEVAGDGYYICSNCNNDVYDATDFCPNCGSYNGGESDDKG